MDKTYADGFIKKFTSDESFARFLSAVRGGDNEVLHNVVSQAVMLDDGWILTLESGLYSIEQIVRNPRKFIAENELIVDVAKARRTNSKTVRHLSSHSQYIQNISKDGEVMPKKLLTAELEEDIAIYENRFIAALINRLILFVEQRHKDLEGKMDVYDQTNVKLRSEFSYGDTHFRCNVEMQVEEPPENRESLDKNQDLYDRVEVIRKRLRVLQATDFMKALSNKKPVRPPIQKTNLLTKNVDYNNCYKLWLYVSSYTYLGYSIEVKDKPLPVENDYYDDLTMIAGLSVQSLISDRILRKEKYDAIEFSAPQEKDFTLVNNLTFNPNFDSSKAQVGEESINEYYYRRMKDELTAIAQEGEFAVENKLSVNFTKFFRSISRINDEMYNELIEQQIAVNKDKLAKTPAEKKLAEVKEQQERLRRRKLFLKLKWEELERAQRMNERAEAKLAKLREQLEEERRKERPKRVTVKKLKTVTVRTVKKGDDKKQDDV